MLTNFYFSPTHRSVSDTLSSLFYWVYTLITNNSSEKEYKGYQYVLPVIGYIVMMFGCLVYHEILILFVFGFEKNTKQEVAKRSDEENKAFEGFDEDLIKD